MLLVDFPQTLILEINSHSIQIKTCITCCITKYLAIQQVIGDLLFTDDIAIEMHKIHMQTIQHGD